MEFEPFVGTWEMEFTCPPDVSAGAVPPTAFTYPPIAVPVGGVHIWLRRFMQGGSDCDPDKAIRCPTTADCVPETLVPLKLMVGVGGWGSPTVRRSGIDGNPPPSPLLMERVTG